MLTSYPEDEQMYASMWDENRKWTLPSGNIDWQQVSDEDHHWDVEQVHEYPFHMTGEKLWPDPHAMVSDGFIYAICQYPFGPEGCFQVGSCGVLFHL